MKSFSNASTVWWYLECFPIQDDVICLVLRTHPATKAYQSFCTNTKAASNCSYWYRKICIQLFNGQRVYSFESSVPFQHSFMHLHTQPASVGTSTTNAAHEPVNSLSPSTTTTRTATTKRGKAPLVCACISDDEMQRCSRTPAYACMRRTTHDSVEIEQAKTDPSPPRVRKYIGVDSRLVCRSPVRAPPHTHCDARTQSHRLYPFDDIATMCMSVCERVLLIVCYDSCSMPLTVAAVTETKYI